MRLPHLWTLALAARTDLVAPQTPRHHGENDLVQWGMGQVCAVCVRACLVYMYEHNFMRLYHMTTGVCFHT
jgi:hypothetical protein